VTLTVLIDLNWRRRRRRRRGDGVVVCDRDWVISIVTASHGPAWNQVHARSNGCVGGGGGEEMISFTVDGKEEEEGRAREQGRAGGVGQYSSLSLWRSGLI
jgi:hypothetical protein